MKKALYIFFLGIFLISACEKDDFCTQNPVTPNLVLRFYDNTDPTALKTVDSLYVWAEGKDSIVVNQSTDSIAIPLNTIAPNTVYFLAQGTLLQNKITIAYTTQEEYVSRSCGFKITFNDVTLTDDSTNSNVWINSFTPTSLTTINNQNAAHVQISH